MGTVWLVQLSSYPLWAHVGLKEFYDYHIAWWHSIWIPVLFPAGLAFVVRSRWSGFALRAYLHGWGSGRVAPGRMGGGDSGLVAPLMMKIGENAGRIPGASFPFAPEHPLAASSAHHGIRILVFGWQS